jgi:hypothetical protein
MGAKSRAKLARPDPGGYLTDATGTSPLILVAYKSRKNARENLHLTFDDDADRAPLLLELLSALSSQPSHQIGLL